MSNMIAHLAVAYEILKLNNDIIKNEYAYYLGSVAPDTIGSKPDVTRNDKKIVHLREDISDIDWLNDECMELFNSRVFNFVNKYINNDVDINQRDFNIGYLVHLSTDKWNHKTIRQKMLKYANEIGINEKDKDFFYMMINDLEALDNYILENNYYIQSIYNMITNDEVKYDLAGFIEKEYISKSINWWNNEYLLGVKLKELKYLKNEDIDYFIKVSSNNIVKELRELLK
ncbi:MAG: zinc dependent phospholipase C family protein [Acholeplasmatales bacterium]|nr:zinc dependent phospholipase C family protein [Acholeplasmatales bacterium]